MTRLALALLFLAMPVHAGDSVPGGNYMAELGVGFSTGAVIGLGAWLLSNNDPLRFIATLIYGLAIALIVLLTAPAWAGDNAPGALLWPPEPRYEAAVVEASVIGPLWGCMDAGTCCGVHVDCGGWVDDPAPVPLPGAIFYLAAGIAALLIWKGSKHV